VIENPLSLNGIRAVFFDLDGTLRHSRPSYNHTVFDVAAQFGVLDADEMRREALRWAHYYFASSPEIQADLQSHKDDDDGFMTNYVRRYLIVYGCSEQQAASLAPRIFAQLSQTLRQEDWIDPDAPSTLERLKEAGFTLAVVSNRWTPIDDLLDDLGLGTYFEFSLAAGEVDSWKPDAAIFQHAMQRAGSCPDCTIYVGDNYYADVVGAQRAGMLPVLLDPEGLFPEVACTVIRSLRELGQSLS
jgi:HAD superfamily hydrolase (TIGR01549 family)